MYKVVRRKNLRQKRALRIRESIFGTSEKPRLTVFRSLKYIYAQLIDDSSGKTLVDVSADVKELHKKGNKTACAFETGKLLAKKASDLKIKKVVFDRKGYRYHGRVKSLADGAREGGLEF